MNWATMEQRARIRDGMREELDRAQKRIADLERHLDWALRHVRPAHKYGGEWLAAYAEAHGAIDGVGLVAG